MKLYFPLTVAKTAHHPHQPADEGGTYLDEVLLLKGISNLLLKWDWDMS